MANLKNLTENDNQRILATVDYVDEKVAEIAGGGEIVTDVFYAGPTAPSNTKLLWVDTTAYTGGLKYFNGSSWEHVPVAYT